MTRKLFHVIGLAIGLAPSASCGTNAAKASGVDASAGGASGAAGDMAEGGETSAPEGTIDASEADAVETDGSEVDASAISHACDIGNPLGDAGATPAIDPGIEGDGDFTIGPDYMDAVELSGRAGVPRGALRAFTIASTPGSIFPGLTGPSSRNVTVYIPSQYVPGAPAPIMVVQDGSSFIAWLPSILNNLISDRLVPPIIAILINPGAGNDERSLEYDTLSDAYATFIETEVLPVVEQQYGVTLTRDPDGRAAMGWSSGGAAAFTMGWMYPNRYHRILAYSGSFVSLQTDALYPRGAWEYHEHLISDCEAKPLRVFLEVGDNDNGATAAESTYRNWVLANQRMAAALKAKGYHYRSLLATNAGHIAEQVVRQTLPETLVWLWRGYPIP